MDAEREQKEIRERAYHIWEQEDRPPGKEHEHWHRAAQEVDSEPEPQRRATRTSQLKLPPGKPQSPSRLLPEPQLQPRKSKPNRRGRRSAHLKQHRPPRNPQRRHLVTDAASLRSRPRHNELGTVLVLRDSGPGLYRRPIRAGTAGSPRTSFPDQRWIAFSWIRRFWCAGVAGGKLMCRPAAEGRAPAVAPRCRMRLAFAKTKPAPADPAVRALRKSPHSG